MHARYITAQDITVSIASGEVWRGNVGPFEVSFNTSSDIDMEILDATELTPDPYVEPPPEFPEITRRQIRLWLLSKGISVADVEVEIEKLAEPQRSIAKIEWDGNTFKRENPFVDTIGLALGFTSQQMDIGWSEAATL